MEVGCLTIVVIVAAESTERSVRIPLMQLAPFSSLRVDVEELFVLLVLDGVGNGVGCGSNVGVSVGVSDAFVSTKLDGMSSREGSGEGGEKDGELHSCRLEGWDGIEGFVSKSEIVRREV